MGSLGRLWVAFFVLKSMPAERLVLCDDAMAAFGADDRCGDTELYVKLSA